MKFHTYRETPVGASDYVCHQRKITFLVAAVLSAAMMIVTMLFDIPSFLGLPPSRYFVKFEWLFLAFHRYIGVAITLVATMVFTYGWFLSFKPSNWLIRHGEAGLLVNIRSYNAKAASDDLVVLDISRDEIQWIREGAIVILEQSDNGTTRNTIRYLDIALQTTDLRKLAALLRADRDRQLGRTKVGARFSDLTEPLDTQLKNTGPEKWCQPQEVVLVDRCVLRITWETVSPKLAKAVEDLAPRLRTRIEEKVALDFTRKPKDREQQEQLVVRLNELGRYPYALFLARRWLGLTGKDGGEFLKSHVQKSA